MSGLLRLVPGRVRALLLLCVLVLAIVLGPAAAYVDLLDADIQSLDQKERLLLRYRRLAAQGQPIGAPIADRAVLFPASSEAEASALLQERVKGAANAAHVQIDAAQVLRPDKPAIAGEFGVRVRGRADIAALNGFLHAIETAAPVLGTDNLQIQSHAARPGLAGPVPLDFQLDIAAWREKVSS